MRNSLPLPFLAATACMTLFMTLCMTACAPRHPEAEQSAVEAATAWLGQVDQGHYAESWEEAAAYFRGAITQEGWVQAMNGMREPLGETLSREVRSSKYHTRLPGAPDGEYVVIEFRTSFARNQSAVETVTPVKDADGVWRVSGYFIR